MNELTKIEGHAVASRPPEQMSSLAILNAAIAGGITKENIDVVKALVDMRREEQKEQNKAAFAKAFFNLRKSISVMDFYANKIATTKSGAAVYAYCSEQELSKVLEPVLFQNGFTMLFGQRFDNGRIVAIVTLMHEGGHEETREYAVRAGATNAMKDETAADAGAGTTAWRHLVIKMFGLKSRIREDSDARNEGDPNAKVTPDQADELERRCKDLNRNVGKFLALAGATKFSEIPSRNYEMLDRMLCELERGTR